MVHSEDEIQQAQEAALRIIGADKAGLVRQFLDLRDLLRAHQGFPEGPDAVRDERIILFGQQDGLKEAVEFFETTATQILSRNPSLENLGFDALAYN